MSEESRWKYRPPSPVEIETMLRMLRDSGYGIAADLIESLIKDYDND